MMGSRREALNPLANIKTMDFKQLNQSATNPSNATTHSPTHGTSYSIMAECSTPPIPHYHNSQ